METQTVQYNKYAFSKLRIAAFRRPPARGAPGPAENATWRCLETLFGLVRVRRVGYSSAGCKSLCPLDAGTAPAHALPRPRPTVPKSARMTTPRGRGWRPGRVVGCDGGLRGFEVGGLDGGLTGAEAGEVLAVAGAVDV
jgi:hypothetical protein